MPTSEVLPIMFKNLKPSIVGILLLMCLLSSNSSVAQLTQLSVGGQITLDSGVADKNYSIKVIVRRHTIDSVETCTTFPFFFCTVKFIYPISETYSTTVVMRRGTNSIGYRVNRGFLNGIKVSVKFECGDCSGVSPNQYYTPQGGSLEFSNAALINGDEVPATVDIALQTTVAIKGTITLSGEEPSDEALDFSVLVFSAAGDSFIATHSNIILPAGETMIDYQVAGLPSETSIPSYRVELRCNNCSPALQPINYGSTLASGSGHDNIDFVVELLSYRFLPAVYDLLLDN